MLSARFCADDLADLIETEECGVEGLVSQLISDFRERLDGYLAEIETAQNTRNFAELKRFSHTLKSTARILGLREASNICRQIETLAKEDTFDHDNLVNLRTEIFLGLAELEAFNSRRKNG